MSSSCVGYTQGLAVRSAALLILLWAFFLADTWGQNQWLKKPQDVLVSRGGNVTFECQSPNNSTSIVWTQGPKVVFNNGYRTVVTPLHFSLTTPFTLSITGVQDQDAGQYGCNVLDYGSVSAQLTVAVLPGLPSLTLSHLGDIFREGESISMTCQSVGGKPLPTITWMKNGVQLVMPSMDVTGNVSRSTLNVTLSHSDHGANYTCFVYNLLNEYQPLIVSRIFSVQYSPIISFDPFGPYTVRLGQPAQVTCLVDANPSVNTVTWQKDEHILPNVQPVLSFKAVSRQDSGNYTCYAANSLNSATPTRLSIYISVVYPPNVTVPSSLTVQEGTPLSVNCTVDANPDPWEVKWEKINEDGSSVQVSRSQSLVMTNVSRGDQGSYSCQASNRLSIADSAATENVESKATMTLFVSYPPGLAVISKVFNISIGQKLVLTCSADPEGYPSATFQWWKTDKELSQNASFVIDKVSLSDTGNYTCIPSNSQGSGLSAQVTVSVNEPPSLTTTLPETMTDVINSSQVFNLTCRSRGHPKPTIQWFKEDKNLQDAKDFYFIEVSTLPVDIYSYEVTSMLTFKGLGRQQLDGGERTHLRVEDTGNYTCTATSPIYSLSVNSTVMFFVQFAPVQLSVVQKVAVMLSYPASLHCQVQAYPAPVFSWYRNKLQLTTMSSSSLAISEFPVSAVVSGYGSHLMINRVGAGDFGSYQCVAVNVMGNVTQTLTITTKSTPEAPFDLKVLDTTWESVHLQWTAGFDGGYIQQFKLQYQETDDKGSGMQEKPDEAINVTWYNVTGLKPSTTYKLAVFALNFLGASKPSTTITSQTSDLDIPHLDDNSLVFSAVNGQLSINYHLPAMYCLKIQVQVANNWQTTHMCTELDSVALTQTGITAVNVSVCLLSRPDVCGKPTAAVTANTGSWGIKEREVIIIACVCAAIIVTLLVILVCFICRRRQANAKEYAEERESQPPPVNGSVSSKKPQAQTQPQVYNNIDSRYPAFSSSELEPPYWDMSSRHVGCMEDNSFDSERERHMMELQLSRQNEAIYGSADGFRNRQDVFNSSTVLRGGGREKYIDLEDHQDPSLQSQESGYSTGDTAKPKKGGFPRRLAGLSVRRHFFRRPHGRSHVHPQERFSHSPPGHTCGLPCCQEDAPIPLRVPSHVDRYRCIPVASGEMTVAHNFTLRKQRLLQDRPSLSAKFFSLQTPGGVRGKARMMLPTFRDDSEVSTAENNNLRHSTFLRPSAVFETGGISHFLSPPSPGCAAVVARGRYLWPWERFISREIALPDTPSGSRRMLALDFQPGDSHDDSDTEDSDIASTACQEDASSATSALEKPESSKVKGVFHEQNSCANDRDDKCVAGDKSCDDMLSNLPVGDRKCGDQLRTYVSDDDDVNSEDEKLDDINIEDKCRDDGVGSDIVSDHVYNEVDDDSLCRSWLQDQVAITNLRNKWPTVNRTLSLEDFAILSRADSLSKMETLSSRNALTPEAKHLLISLYRAGEGEEARYSTFPTRCKPHHTYETLKTTAGRTAAAHSSPPLLPPRRNSSGLVGGHRTGRIGQMDRVGGHDEMVSLLPPEHRAGACSLATDTRLLGHLSTPACEDIWIRRQTLEKKGDEVTYLEREGEETALTGGIREADVVTSVESKDVAGLLVRLRCLPESPVTLIL